MFILKRETVCKYSQPQLTHSLPTLALCTNLCGLNVSPQGLHVVISAVVLPW